MVARPYTRKRRTIIFGRGPSVSRSYINKRNKLMLGEEKKTIKKEVEKR